MAEACDPWMEPNEEVEQSSLPWAIQGVLVSFPRFSGHVGKGHAMTTGLSIDDPAEQQPGAVGASGTHRS